MPGEFISSIARPTLGKLGVLTSVIRKSGCLYGIPEDRLKSCRLLIKKFVFKKYKDLRKDESNHVAGTVGVLYEYQLQILVRMEASMLSPGAPNYLLIQQQQTQQQTCATDTTATKRID